jgi:putative ABC transport system ATP-binding protein
MMTLERVSKTVRSAEGDKQVLRDVTLSVDAGSFVALTGRSGAGKSSLLAIAGGLDDSYEGNAAVLGKEWRTLSDRARAKQRNTAIGFVLQIPRLFSHLSLWQNLTAPLWIAGRRTDEERGKRLLERVGLAASLHRPVSGMSGGERQRLTLARALINRPALLLCDEPTGNLDRQSGKELLELLADLQREEQLTIFVVTHDPDVIARASSVLTLQSGTLAS